MPDCQFRQLESNSRIPCLRMTTTKDTKGSKAAKADYTVRNHRKILGYSLLAVALTGCGKEASQPALKVRSRSAAADRAAPGSAPPALSQVVAIPEGAYI